MPETTPDDASWKDVQYSTFVRERIERGRREAGEGNVIDQGEIELRMKEWLDD
jgi:hypothetical protein